MPKKNNEPRGSYFLGQAVRQEIGEGAYMRVIWQQPILYAPPGTSPEDGRLAAAAYGENSQHVKGRAAVLLKALNATKEK